MPAAQDLYIGIDPAFGNGKRLPVAVCALERGRAIMDRSCDDG